jgi:transcriptional regulator with XRE-family HTH domain
MKFGEIIRVFRKNNKMTMQEFADKAGLSKGYISMLEKNQHPQSQRRLVPSFETYLKVASAMNMSIDELVALLDDNETVRLNESSSSAPELELTEQEEELLNGFRSLSDEQKIRVIAYLEGTLDSSGNLGAMLRSEADKIVNKEKEKAAMSAKKAEVF